MREKMAYGRYHHVLMGLWRAGDVPIISSWHHGPPRPLYVFEAYCVETLLVCQDWCVRAPWRDAVIAQRRGMALAKNMARSAQSGVHKDAISWEVPSER